MGLKATDGGYSNNSETFDGDKGPPSDSENVPQRDKREVVLEFMSEHELPLRPKEIYGGLIYQQDITFSYRTVQNIVSELNEDSLIRRVRIDDAAGEVVDIPTSESGRRAYYLITDSGKDLLQA